MIIGKSRGNRTPIFGFGDQGNTIIRETCYFTPIRPFQADHNNREIPLSDLRQFPWQ